MARGAIACGLSLTLATAPLAGCASRAGGSSATTAPAATSSTAARPADPTEASQTGGVTVIDAEDVFSERDLTAAYDDTVVNVTLSDDGCSADGSGVAIEGSTVRIGAAGTYLISGTLSDGQVVVDAPDEAKVQLVLAGASITSSNGAAILVEGAKKAFVTVADGTQNSLSSTGGLNDNESKVDGTVFSRSDLTLNGSGALDITSCAHGIVCKDSLVLADATVTVTAEKSAVQAKDSLAVGSGSWTLSAGTDCLHAESDDTSKGWVLISGGTLTMTAGDDGIHASGAVQVDGGDITAAVTDDGLHAEWELAVNGGTINITSCTEGLEGSKVYIAGGESTIVSSDDGVNAAGEPDDADSTGQAAGQLDPESMMADDTASLSISGGKLVVTASGDGLDSNGDLSMSGGEVYISGPTSGADGSLDYGEGSTASITGGTIVCAGSSGMAENFGDTSTQPCALVSLSGSTGDTITVTDTNGNTLASMVAGTSYDCVIASTSGMNVGDTYTVSNGSSSVEVTFDSVVYSDVQGGFGAFGNFGGFGAFGGVGGSDESEFSEPPAQGQQDGDGSQMSPPNGMEPPNGTSNDGNAPATTAEAAVTAG